MPVPLTRKERKRGTLYQRPLEIETHISTLEAIDPAARLTLFTTFSRKAIGYVPSEAVLYFLRRSWADGNKDNFEKIFRILLARVNQLLRSKIWDSRIGTATDICDEIIGRFVVLITEDCNTGSGSLDFYEIHFDSAMKALRTSVLRKFQAAAGDITLVPLNSQQDNDHDFSPEVETALERFRTGHPEKIDDPAFRLVLFTAINKLPQDQRRVVYLFLEGIPIDAKDQSATTIANILQCNERTVRNRLNRAYKTLKADLEKEIEA